MMKKVGDLYKAQASSPLETAMLHDGRVGFVVPEYQRQYDWSAENIKRLHYDMLNGFERLSSSAGANAFTFLGAVILVEEEIKEEDFSGESIAIVDGQQRLTTLTLVACALCESIRLHLSDIESSKINPTIAKWLRGESDDRLFALYRCAIGSQNVTPTKTYPFPRIVRRDDVRAKSKSQSYYKSAIGTFLEGFATFFETDETEYVPPVLGSGTDAGKLAINFQYIRSLVNSLNNAEWYEDTDCELFDIEWIRYAQCRSLFERLPDFIKSDGERNKAIEDLIKSTVLHDLVRTLLFSAYFCNCVVLTRVTTEDESAAFDIFDALNTTGEPLTALETLKPRVINFERNKSGYPGSESERAFARIAEFIDNRFLETKKKQDETKNLIVTFSLYLTGQKISKDLAAQRIFLRTNYDNATKKGEEAARTFVDSLADIAEFRRSYWESKGIQELGRFHNPDTLDKVQLLASLIRDMNTSLALPIIARYWDPALKHTGDTEFVQVLKAVAAFLVIRRAATGGTAGIDGDFRGVMAPSSGRGASRKFGLCAGIDHENKRLSPNELKEALKTLLQHKLKALDKESWVQCVVANPLYKQSQELVRFMFLAAGHQAMPSSVEAGTWTKTGVKVSPHDKDFLNYKTWSSEHYATVEHIAPQQRPERGWPKDLYDDNILRHSLGNLILLPAKENSVIGSDSWKKKKKFYLALTEASVDEQNKRIEEAKAAGIRFSETTTKLLRDGNRLSLLEPLRGIDEWQKDTVLRRSRNVAELCWDTVWPWLN